MKYNLKNRPVFPLPKMKYQHDVEDWFEGFEAELREKLKNRIVGTNMQDDYIDGRLDQIKEILGE